MILALGISIRRLCVGGRSIRRRSKGDGQQRAYGFGYDSLNRLLYADFNQYSSAWDKTAGVDFTTLMGNGTDPNTAYDENGNIKAMLQTGWQLGGSHPIDSLNYTYYSNSNKLKNVIDGRNDPTTTLGDFRTSSLSPYNTGKTTSAVDYVYDVKGNMTRDLNKDIGSQTADGIVYNHLNLPYQVTVRSATGTKGTITYIYDAAGNKLKKTTLDSIGSLQTVTAYLGAFQYQSKSALADHPADTLQFFGQEEGRIRVTHDTTAGPGHTAFQYDYFLKDHLGNTRMVLTDERQTDKYPAATMEVSDSATENLYYSKLDSTRTALPSGYPTDTTTNPNNYVAQLNGSGHKIGPGITLKVMAGDTVSIRVSSWYKLNGTSPGTPANPLPDLLGALISGIGGLPGAGHPSSAVLQANSTPLSDNISHFLGDTGSVITQTKPHAFINWVLFDNQFNYVASSSGFEQVGNDQELKKHVIPNLAMTSSGYLYIYTSNETSNVNVFFDNLQVTHLRGPMLEENHYYPFGLTMAAISDRAINFGNPYNKYKYNSIEHNIDLGTSQYDAFYRTLDPQVGRFWQLDPQADILEHYSPYESMGNSPTNNQDPLGDFKTWFGATLYKIRHGGSVSQNQYGEWGVTTTKTTLDNDGTPTVTATSYYGEGRNKYTKAGEEIEAAEDQREFEDNFVRKGYFVRTNSLPEAKEANFQTFVGGLMPIGMLKANNLVSNLKRAGQAREITKGVEELKIIFGGDANKIYHAFRHTDELGLARETVMEAIREHLPTVVSQMVEGKPLINFIEIGGQKIQYNAFKLADGTINVGRIHGVN